METIWQIFALIKKEFLAVFKDPANRVTLFVPVLLQSLLFGYAATYDLNHVPYTLLDQSHGAAATKLVADLDGTGVFERVATLDSANQIADTVNSGKALLVLSIPSDFESRLSDGQAAPLQVILDGRNSTTAGFAATYLSNIVAAYNQERSGKAPQITVVRRMWYNPNQETRWVIMPALIASLSVMQTLLLAALSVAREREQGTFDQLLVTPLTPFQILIGKAVPSVCVGLLQSTLILLIIRFWFEVPMAGSLWLMYLGLLSFTLAAVGIGLSISALSSTMQQAMLYTFVLIMPMILLSGMLTAVKNMPQILQTATIVNPLRFGIEIIRRVYLEGAGFGQIAHNFIPLIVIAALTLPLAAWLFRNKLS
ncbi:ABC transporter permease [Neisseria perflava]|uniref:ABC transporter permease n=1 Tax=Neisseria perflava TaxID=33053 RepID=UPI00209CF92E|nr:ABC transporter permease [Neisseria perflava]MCP1659400.1 ABC-2 type transport system permease protein [Neisseria perflava]MCP1772157.1 ABC-2 type transport system permease protein [Neisseria perflava]